jgi:hypothetical protein
METHRKFFGVLAEVCFGIGLILTLTIHEKGKKTRSEYKL